MSSEAATAPRGDPDNAVDIARRSALRLAFGVTASFAAVELLGWDATFVAPLLAANMLAALQRPPGLAQGLVILVLIAFSTGAVLVLTSALMSKPLVLLLALTFTIYASFYAHQRGAPSLATLLPQISAVTIPVIAILSPGGAGAFAGVLVKSGIAAVLTVWMAFAVFPAPAGAGHTVSGASETDYAIEPRFAAWRALLDTLVLFPLLAWYVLDASTVSVVVLITIVSLLRQHDPQQGLQAAFGKISGTLIGGIMAAVVYELVLLGHSAQFFIAACLASCLFFAGRIVTAGDRAPVYLAAFTTFILLLGIGLTSLPGGSGEAFVSRLINVVLASAYTIGGVSLLERWRTPAPVLPGQRL